MAREKIILSKEQESEVERLSALGFTIKNIADSLGISKATLDRRISESNELKALVSKGRMNGLSDVASTAYKMAVSGKHPRMTMFWLERVGKWNIAKEDESEKEQIKLVFTRDQD